MSDLSDKAYFQLRPDERLRAALSAAARHDGYELDRLIDTCEKKTYRMEDQDFMHPLRGFARMAERQRATITRLTLSAITLVAMMQVAADDQPTDHTEAALDAMRAAISGYIEAWETFCRECGLNDQEIPSTTGLQEDETLALPLRILQLDAVEADAEGAITHLSKLREEWKRWQ